MVMLKPRVSKPPGKWKEQHNAAAESTLAYLSHIRIEHNCDLVRVAFPTLLTTVTMSVDDASQICQTNIPFWATLLTPEVS